MARFIRFPWATTGDRTSVPFDTDPGGAVTYAQGFGPSYEIAPGDPGWRPVPRDETNGLYYDLTDNLRQYQLYGAPEWHPAADNAGIAISYPINSTVYYGGLVYRSLVANNTVEPGTDATKWAVFAIVDPTSVSNAYINAGRPAQAARYFTASGVANAATYVNNTASKSTDLVLASSSLGDATFSGGELTVGASTAGFWTFSANLGIQTNFNGWTSKVLISKNGGTPYVGYTEALVYGTPATGNISVSGGVYLAAGDKVAAYMVQNTGSSQGSSSLGSFSGVRVGV